MNGVIVGRDGDDPRRRAARMCELVKRVAGERPEAILDHLAQEWGWWVGTPEQIAEQASAAAQRSPAAGSKVGPA